MKKLAILSVLVFLAVLILLPSSHDGKYDVSKPLVADGSPLPWPIPHSTQSDATLVADGSPLPWPIPHSIADGWPLPPLPPRTAETLTADGSPLPWPIPHSTQSDATLVADGSPLPWPIPPQSAIGA